MVLAIVTEMPLQLHPVEPDPFLDPPASDHVDLAAVQSGAAADTVVAGTDERVLTR